jgi:hypothetical protein
MYEHACTKTNYRIVRHVLYFTNRTSIAVSPIIPRQHVTEACVVYHFIQRITIGRRLTCFCRPEGLIRERVCHKAACNG